MLFHFILQGTVLPVASSMKQYPLSGPSGRGQVANRVSSAAVASQPTEGATLDPLIGRRVRTRWPDDNNFYEAVITDYNPVEVYIWLLIAANLDSSDIVC